MQRKQHKTVLTNLFNNDATTSYCDEISYVLFIFEHKVFISDIYLYNFHIWIVQCLSVQLLCCLLGDRNVYLSDIYLYNDILGLHTTVKIYM